MQIWGCFCEILSTYWKLPKPFHSCTSGESAWETKSDPMNQIQGERRCSFRPEEHEPGWQVCSHTQALIYISVPALTAPAGKDTGPCDVWAELLTSCWNFSTAGNQEKLVPPALLSQFSVLSLCMFVFFFSPCSQSWKPTPADGIPGMWGTVTSSTSQCWDQSLQMLMRILHCAYTACTQLPPLVCRAQIQISLSHYSLFCLINNLWLSCKLVVICAALHR